jgi:hypothetical protein
MQQFDVAHVRERGVDLIIVFVNDRVRYMSDEDRGALAVALTLCARSAGLAGAVVLVWPGGFFADRDLLLAASVNTQLTCDNL